MKRTAAVLVGATALGVALAAATSAVVTSAPAAPLPVIYSGMGGRWANAAVRPHEFVLGARYYMEGMTWSRWAASSALGRGEQIACAGEAGPCDNYPVTVTLINVQRHDGRAYYAAMKVGGSGHKAYRLVMRGGAWQRE
jgi:hypothetical protein